MQCREWILARAIGSAVLFSVAAAALAEVVPPRPLEQEQPDPPTSRFGFPMEGWAVVRYSVQVDGHTANVRVIDRMPPGLVERETISAVEDWTFEPAKNDGTPIEWHNNESVIIFDVPTTPPEPSPFFALAYGEIENLIKSQELDKALTRNETTLETGTSRLSEFGIALVQNAIINMSLGDLHAAYSAIRRATDPRISVLGTDELKVALQYRNALELELGDAAGAVATFARRSEIEAVPEGDATAAKIAAIEEALGGSEAPIAIKGKIVDHRWLHTPTRRTFAIANVAGELEAIQVECNRRRTEVPFAPDSEWSLPASWGACSLTVEGRNDTAFLFYEFP